MSIIGLPLILFEVGADVGDLEFLRDLELSGDLVHLLSSEFTSDADQITFVPASGKTFFHIRSKLYPVTDTVVGLADSAGLSAINRRADVELTFDSVVKDVLTYDFEAYQNDRNYSGAQSNMQDETNIFESMVGNGSKSIKLTSTNNSGTYRVSMLGWIQTT